MKNSDLTVKLDPCPLESILGVWKFRRLPGNKHRCSSTPGHLLHLVVAGDYLLRTNGRQYNIQPGDIIYYHESEDVEWLENNNTVIFYSVGFLAPELQPLPFNMRVFQATGKLHQAFIQLYTASLETDPSQRIFEMYSALFKILFRIEKFKTTLSPSPEKLTLWQEIEQLIRKNHQFRPTLDELCEMCQYSRATIIRSCRRTTGMSPIKYIRKIRMEEAKGLLQYSLLNVTQTADYLGYPRLHEFSREFSAYFSYPPSSLRKPVKIT